MEIMGAYDLSYLVCGCELMRSLGKFYERSSNIFTTWTYGYLGGYFFSFEASRPGYINWFNVVTGIVFLN